MTERIPTEARDAIRAELQADSDDYRDAVPEGTWAKPNRGQSAMLTFRIPAETLEALQALAKTQGIPVSTMARDFIAEGLSNFAGDDLRSALERLERDVAAVKARALAL